MHKITKARVDCEIALNHIVNAQYEIELIDASEDQTNVTIEASKAISSMRLVVARLKRMEADIGKS